MSLHDRIQAMQRLKAELYECAQTEREILWNCRKTLKEPLTPDERGEFEQMGFNALQRLKTIDEELERANETISLLREAQRKEDMQDVQHTGLVVVVVVCAAVLLFLIFYRP